MKHTVLFLSIILLGILLRFYKLGEIPSGFYSDEAAYAYNAYSLLETGKDEYGASFPIGFRSFGDYKTPLFIYLLVPFIWIFGMSESVIRSASASLGIVSIIVLYRISRELGFSAKISLLSIWVFTTLPFSLQFHRMAHENSLSVALMLFGVLLFLMAKRHPSMYVASSIGFSLSMYAYHDARVLAPSLVIFLCWYMWKYIRLEKTYIGISLVCFFVFLIPLMLFITDDVFWSRPSKTIFFSDTGITSRIDELHGEDHSAHFPIARIFHNKAVGYFTRFVENITVHLSPSFLFFQGDGVKIYQTPEQGVLFLLYLPIIWVGCVYLMQAGKKGRLVLIALLLSIVPAAMTKYVPSASRMLFFAPMVSVCLAGGIYVVLSRIRSRMWIIVCSVLVVINMLWYMHMYYIHIPVAYAKEWHYGMKQVMQEVSHRGDAYERVWFSKHAWGYIYALYYLRYPPVKYHAQARLGPLNEFGFGWVSGFDRYIFDDIPPTWQTMKNTLFIGIPQDFGFRPESVFSIQYPDGEEAFIGVEVQ